jgi:hypothetical protein
LLPPSSGRLPIIALMMRAANTSETSVNFYQTTRRNKPEDNHLYSRRHESLKSHLKINLAGRFMSNPFQEEMLLS